MNPSISYISSCTILDIPDEILHEIMLLLNARERVAFANSSQRFYSLVFQGKQLLRDLDFSEEGRLTSLSDLHEYFKSKRISKHILKVNLTNVTCISSGKKLRHWLSKAKNLIDLNVQGIKFNNIIELGSFLVSFSHLERLSIDWPRTIKADIFGCRILLETSFTRLKYLSIRMLWTNYSPEFIDSLHLCEQLEELRIFQICSPFNNYEDIWTVPQKTLKNLKIVEYWGPGSTWVVHHIGLLFTDPMELTHFCIARSFPFAGFRFERNVEVCKQLADSKFYFQRHLSTHCLLLQVIITTHETPSKYFCCLPPQHKDESPFLMKIEEMKLLLKEPSYQIQYLNISHCIEENCDVHLLVSVFQTLTELVLTNIIVKNKEENSQCMTHPNRRLKKFGAVDCEGLLNENKDSSFKMLVENTPRLKVLTVNANVTLLYGNEDWDLEALYLIARWKNLRSLCLKFVPITDGKFLIEIGKECVNLRKVEFHNLGPRGNCLYLNKLPQMLDHCKNLREFTLKQSNLCQFFQMSKVLLLFHKNSELKRVWIRSRAHNETTKNLISSIEQLLKQCSKLNTLFCVIDGMSSADSDKLTVALRRLRIDLNRPTLQFQVADESHAEDLVREDYSPQAFSLNLERYNRSLSSDI